MLLSFPKLMSIYLKKDFEIYAINLILINRWIFLYVFILFFMSNIFYTLKK